MQLTIEIIKQITLVPNSPSQPTGSPSESAHSGSLEFSRSFSQSAEQPTREEDGPNRSARYTNWTSLLLPKLASPNKANLRRWIMAIPSPGSTAQRRATRRSAAFAIRNDVVGRLACMLQNINDRFMIQPLLLRGAKFVTIISTYASVNEQLG
ncbi:hypothetical protein SprV_0200863000 [Sparganum proliferum]